MKMLNLVSLGAALPLAMWTVSPSAFAAQASFTEAEQLSSALVVAVARRDEDQLVALLGERFLEVVGDGAPAQEMADKFVTAWINFHGLNSVSANVRELTVGENGWTFPFPLVKGVDGWRFDLTVGYDNMRIRRIGRNELAMIQSALAYRDAQLEYIQEDRDGDGIKEYAQKFVSSYGQKDGLYWPAAETEPQSPLGPMFAKDDAEEGYHGYRFHILTAQGAEAEGGALDYVDSGNLVGGFGLLAWPVEYGQTGVMSLMMDENGNILEADLGSDSAQVAAEITMLNPDGRWQPVDGEDKSAD